jgi:hypothetical protein
MKRHGILFILTTLAAAALLAGCSDKSSSTAIGGGEGPLATATPVGIDVCYNCHANTAVGGVGIFAAWAESRHANLDNTFDVFENQAHGRRPGYHSPDSNCGRCHNPTDDGANLAFYVGPGSDTGLRDVVGCEACHGGGSLHYGVGPIGGPKLGEFAMPATAGQSSQFNTCTQCHGVEAPLYHGQSERHIHDTHNDNASRAIGSDIQGYVVRKSVDTACTDCHDPHTANMNGSVNRQWKASGHGDFTSEAWKHYQWTAANRQACQRCHTATGAMNFLNDPANYDETQNVFSWLDDPATDRRSEVLYCYACHTDYQGGLRNPGALTIAYSNGASYQYPNSAGSNICLNCHTGRVSGDSIKNSTASFDNTGFLNSHYLAAGGVVFAAIGYHFEENGTERDYSIPADDHHDKIGMGVQTGDANFDAVRHNYTSGPCVSCHFGSTDPNHLDSLTRHSDNTLSHTLSPLTRYAEDDLALNPICVNCHTARGEGSNAAITWLGDDETAATLQGTTHKARYQAALEALRVQLAQSGFHFGPSHPYFFQTADNTASANAVRNWGDATTGKPNMGAAFNYNLLIHDPGGVAHNRRYTRRLIYDAIDWLDDGVLNYSVNETLNAAPHAGADYQASAIAYLLAADTGTEADRH